MTSNQDLHFTPLHALHVELGGKMVPFAGYDMPVHYAPGILAEHLHTREKAGLFDVSHMGQAVLSLVDQPSDGDAAHVAVAKAFERLVPGDICALRPGAMRYTLLLDRAGGILDDLMVWRPPDEAHQGQLYLVVNAAMKAQDFAHIAAKLPEARLQVLEDRALLALQGPLAAEIMQAHGAAVEALTFLHVADLTLDGVACTVSRSGYTGEDGFEISLPADQAVAVARSLLSHDEVWPIGLGARDSLRLEAGLCLYGHDIDRTTDPVAAALAWTIAPRRRREGDFPGAAKILATLKSGPAMKRVGLKPDGRVPAREGTEIQNSAGEVIGGVTSGTFAPSVGGPIAMGYVKTPYAREGTEIMLMVRGKARPARIVSLPFVPHRYHRG